jgi:hypothetical protein
LKLEASDVTDVVVSIEDTIIETRIGAWMASIAENRRVG